jgi:hypothetical protein
MFQAIHPFTNEFDWYFAKGFGSLAKLKKAVFWSKLVTFLPPQVTIDDPTHSKRFMASFESKSVEL